MDTIKLGTRRSLLAWAQSSWVAREIERLNPGLRVELVGIDTRGDKIVDIPLREVAGKEFFVAELDDALRSGRVDMTVHSMKDLSLERPEGFVLAAIPRRANQRDVILFGPGVMEKLRAGRTLRIGTSSPRRQENIPGFLAKALPTVGGRAPSVELVEVRGNVNTRLSRVHEPAGSERALDGVVLAFAGLIRLWADDQARVEMAKLFVGTRWMVLPLKENPSAPAQGALAVECRASDQRVRDALGRLHDADTAARVAMERQILSDWGGGCHQRFGASAARVRDLGDLLWIRGRKPDGEFVEELRWKAPASPGRVGEGEWWNGLEHRVKGETVPTGAALPGLAGSAVFVAHERALPADRGAALKGARVWASGTPSWFKLAARGVWVEGCAEGLGWEYLEPMLREAVLGLPEPGKDWTVFTHEGAAAGWDGARVVATYRLGESPDEGGDAQARARIDALARAKHVYWSSGSQFDRLRSRVPAGARHACGAGKTAAHLRAQGVEPVVFPSVEEWKKWLGK